MYIKMLKNTTTLLIPYSIHSVKNTTDKIRVQVSGPKGDQICERNETCIVTLDGYVKEDRLRAERL